jgi:hypothetical protein
MLPGDATADRVRCNARLCVVIVGGDVQGHQMLIIELPVAGEGFRFRAVDAEADRSIKPDGDLLLGHDRKIDPPDPGCARGPG